jgi:hypothetical protein
MLETMLEVVGEANEVLHVGLKGGESEVHKGHGLGSGHGALDEVSSEGDAHGCAAFGDGAAEPGGSLACQRSRKVICEEIRIVHIRNDEMKYIKFDGSRSEEDCAGAVLDTCPRELK